MSEIEQELLRAITNAQIAKNGVGVGSRDERRAVYNAQKLEADAVRFQACRQATSILQSQPHRSASLNLMIRIALYNPDALSGLV